MKPQQIFFTLCLTLVSFIVVAQNEFDEVKMTDGKTLKGTYISKDSTHIKFRTKDISGSFTTLTIPLDVIEKMSISMKGDRDTAAILKQFTPSHNETMLADKGNVKHMGIKNSGYHLSKGGRFGIAGVAFLIGGSILATVGAIKGIPALAYTGVGVSGLGGVFLIVPFGQMIRAGNKYPKPVN